MKSNDEKNPLVTSQQYPTGNISDSSGCSHNTSGSSEDRAESDEKGLQV